MSKKQIIITIITALIVLLVTILSMYFILNKSVNEDKGNDKEVDYLVVSSYTLKYGKYKGKESEYDYDLDKTIEKEVYLELSKSMITVGDNKQTYTIKGNKLVLSSNVEYEVIANNKINLLAGGGVIYEYYE